MVGVSAQPGGERTGWGWRLLPYVLVTVAIALLTTILWEVREFFELVNLTLLYLLPPLHSEQLRVAQALAGLASVSIAHVQLGGESSHA